MLTCSCYKEDESMSELAPDHWPMERGDGKDNVVQLSELLTPLYPRPGIYLWNRR